MNESAWVMAVPFAKTKISHTNVYTIEIDTFNWTTGHGRKFATESGGDKIFNRLTHGGFHRGLMDRGGKSCKGQGWNCWGLLLNPQFLSTNAHF